MTFQPSRLKWKLNISIRKALRMKLTQESLKFRKMRQEIIQSRVTRTSLRFRTKWLRDFHWLVIRVWWSDSIKYLLLLPYISAGKASKWPVKCSSDKHCYPAKFRAYAGWKNSKARNLVCDRNAGQCVCRRGFIDKNNNPQDGCEFEKCRKG